MASHSIIPRIIQIVCPIAALLVAAPAAAKWELYDDFNDLPTNSPLDPKKWKRNNVPVAGVFIHKKKMRVEFDPGQNDEVLVDLKMDPETIRGIRMDFRGTRGCSSGAASEGLGIRAFIGQTKRARGRAIMNLFFRRPGEEIVGRGEFIKGSNFSALYNSFAKSQTLMGKTTSVMMKWTNKKVKYKAGDNVKMTRKPNRKLKEIKPDNARVLMAFGRPFPNTKPCIIDIDNVEVFR